VRGIDAALPVRAGGEIGDDEVDHGPRLGGDAAVDKALHGVCATAIHRLGVDDGERQAEGGILALGLVEQGRAVGKACDTLPGDLEDGEMRAPGGLDSSYVKALERLFGRPAVPRALDGEEVALESRARVAEGQDGV